MVLNIRGHYRTAVIGLGYVGLPLAQLFVNKGHTVFGIDTDENKIQKLANGKSYLNDLTHKQIEQLLASKRFHPGSAYNVIAQVDVVIICVPTPLDRNAKPDLTFVNAAIRFALPFIKKGQLIILESTTYPGTTEEVLLPMLESKGLVIGKEVALAYSPERIDPGQTKYKLDEIPKVIAGVTEACTKYVKQVYETVFEQVVIVSSPKIAEMTKLLENSQRYINISFMNELAMLCDKMGIDLWEVISAASTKPYGFTPYYPGPGIGGHCIPIDPFYLLWKAETDHQFDLQLIRMARDINLHMSTFVVHKVAKYLSRTDVPIENSRILVIGVTYKKDVGDLRESPAPGIIEGLMDLGADINYFDPYVAELNVGGTSKKRVELTADTIACHDCVLILTDHSTIPYDFIVKHASRIIDTRNKTGHLKHLGNVVLL